MRPEIPDGAGANKRAAVRCWQGACWAWVAAVVSGILQALAFPPADQGWIIWIALVPLLAALWLDPGRSQPSHLDWKRCAALGWVAGMVAFSVQFHWITTVTGVGWIAVSAYLALYPAVWAAIVGVLLHPCGFCGPDGGPAWLVSWKNLAFAAGASCLWWALEWLRGIVFTGFPWNGLGVALHENVYFIQIASITGVGGLSALIVWINVIALITVKRVLLEVGRSSIRPHYDFSLSIALVVLVFSFGIHTVTREVGTFPLKVAAVQPHIPQVEKWDPAREEAILRTFDRLTDAAVAASPDLLVWPEAATPRSIFLDQQSHDHVERIAESTRADFLLGTLEFDEGRDYNSAIMISSVNRSLQTYRKLHLVPFGEFLPLRGIFPPFEWIAGDLIPGDFSAGADPVIFQMREPPVRIAPLICFEDTVARLVRRFAARDSQLLVNITNDGWFLKSAASAQHLANAKFRCAETRLPMVRCANTGVTAFLDHFGRVTRQLEDPESGSTFVEGVLVGQIEIPLRPQPTFHTRNGEIFSVLACLASLLWVGALWVRRRTMRAG